MPSEQNEAATRRREQLQAITKPLKRPLDKARALYCLEPAHIVVEGKVPLVFLIGDFSEALNLMFSEVRVIGSAYLGMSLHKNSPFDPKGSDLDLAVVSEGCYSRLLRAAFEATSGFTNLTPFVTDDLAFFKESTLHGYIDPGTLPSCNEKELWVNVLEQLSEKYCHYFKEVTAMVYCGPWFLEQKMAHYLENNLYRNAK